MALRAKVIHMDEHRPSGPKLEDGYIRIANELFDAILRFRFTLKQQSVVLAVARKTYGYGKKADDVSAAQIGELCGMSRNHVTETLNELAAMNVISKTPGEYGCVIGINKRYGGWKKPEKVKKAAFTSPGSGLVPNRDAPSPESGLLLVPNRDGSIVPIRDTQKTTFQKTTPKDNSKRIAQSADRAASPTADAAFADFWEAFAHKKGKANAKEAFAREFAKAGHAADWLQTVMAAAAKEAQRRPHLIADGQTPIYAQGWLTQRRYEDEDVLAWGVFSAEQQAFIDCFNANIGDTCPQVTEWTEKRAALCDIAMRGKWGIERWAEFWRYVRDECRFGWPVSFEWMLSRENWAKVKGGQYLRDGVQA
jgi:phage replication O-like protein O